MNFFAPSHSVFYLLARGLLTMFSLNWGVIDTGINFIAMDVALYTGLNYAYILLMIFPLYNALETLDKNQLEAAEDLGSSMIRTHFRIVIPHAKAGIASGCTMVFYVDRWCISYSSSA